MINNAVGRLVTITIIFIPMLFVLYSYLRILIVCKKGSAEVRGKALQTCVPHLVTFVSYSFSLFLDLSLSRLDTNKINPIITAVMSLEYLLVPSINNPLIYGLKLPQIRVAISHRLRIRARDERCF
ncbi:unnamed protein product [Knipowitschia caucasica]|uniref:G-protein coupled receptors family 1 profile domain-containing protein n=1 Tax=Knipowitschia caucasica TaxID=637954 RepID=A0AAV2JZS0_KNICA